MTVSPDQAVWFNQLVNDCLTAMALGLLPALASQFFEGAGWKKKGK